MIGGPVNPVLDLGGDIDQDVGLLIRFHDVNGYKFEYIVRRFGH